MCSHCGVDLAALATVPDLSAPDVLLAQGQPQALVERLVLAAGAEDRRGLAEHVLGTVAGDALEGRVDVHDHRLGIGDQNALAGAVEYRRGLAQVVFLEPLQGDVAGHAGVVQRLAQGIAEDPAARVDPAVVAVLVAQAVDVVEIVGQALQVVAVGLQHGGVLFRVQALLPGLDGVAEFLRSEADQRGVARRDEHPVGHQVPIPETVAHRFQGTVQALLAAVQFVVGLGLAAELAYQVEVQEQAGCGEEEQPLGGHPEHQLVVVLDLVL